MLDLNWLRRDAPVWAVLFVILLFLFLQMGMHDSSKHVPVPSVNAAQASAVASKPTVASDVTSSKPQAGLHKLRQGGKLLFPIFRDGTGLMQGVVSQKEQPDAFAALRGLTQESSVEITGKIQREPRAPGGYEIGVNKSVILLSLGVSSVI